MPRPTHRKTCFYDVLGVARTATTQELRKAYRTLALQFHPDKNPDNVEEASLKFHEIQEAFDCLTDPQERAWYDANREHILNPTTNDQSTSDSTDLAPYFSTKCFQGFDDSETGYYTVYSKVFGEIDRKEVLAENQRNIDTSDEDDDEQTINRPAFGSSQAPESVVRAFYSYWSSFQTHRHFRHANKWHLPDAPNRLIRRAMEVENKKIRNQLIKQYSELVQRLVAYVKKRDPRLKEFDDKRAREKAAQDEKARETEKVNKELNKQHREKFKHEQQRKFAQQERERKELYGEIDAEEAEKERKKKATKPGATDNAHFECIACHKSFKSIKQWENHEQSKKHKQEVINYQAMHQAGDNSDDESDYESDEESDEESELDEDIEQQNDQFDDPNALDCMVCDVSFKTHAQLVKHNTLKPHMSAVTSLRAQMEAEEAMMRAAMEKTSINQTKQSKPSAKQPSQQTNKAAQSKQSRKQQSSSDSESDSESDSASDDSGSDSHHNQQPNVPISKPSKQAVNEQSDEDSDSDSDESEVDVLELACMSAKKPSKADKRRLAKLQKRMHIKPPPSMFDQRVQQSDSESSEDEDEDDSGGDDSEHKSDSNDESDDDQSTNQSTKQKTEQSATAPVPLTARQKRKLREAAKKEQAAEQSKSQSNNQSILQCFTCKNVFATRNSLMKHLKAKNHAAPPR